MIETLLVTGISNVAFAAVLAVIAAGACAFVRRPPVAYAIWLIVLLKLVTPPLIPFSIPWARWVTQASEASDGLEVDNAAHFEKNLLPTGAYGPSTDQYGEGTTTQSRQRPGGRPPTGIERASESGTESVINQFTSRAALDLLGNEVSNRHIDAVASRTNSHSRNRAGIVASGIGHGAPDGHSWPFRLPSRRAMVMAIALTWATGSLVWIILAIYRLARFSEIIRTAGAAPDAIVAETKRLASRLGLTKDVRVRVGCVTTSPLVWALGRSPTLLLPKRLMERLEPAQTSALLAHELAHVRRGDTLVRWIEIVVLTIYWWCPVTWWVRRRLHQAEEECCDAWVLWMLPQHRRAYASAILDTIDLLSSKAVAAPWMATGLTPISLLERRIQMILHRYPHRKLSHGSRVAFVIAGVLVLPLAAQVHANGSDQRQRESSAETTTGTIEQTGVTSVDSANQAVAESSFQATSTIQTADSNSSLSTENSNATIESTTNVTDEATDSGPSRFQSVLNSFQEDANTESVIEGASMARTPQPILARARLLSDGKTIQLRYQVSRPVVEHSVQRTHTHGGQVEEQVEQRIRHVMETRQHDLAVDSVRAEIVGRRSPSTADLQSELRSERRVMVLATKNGAYDMLREGTLVFVLDLNDSSLRAQDILMPPTQSPSIPANSALTRTELEEESLSSVTGNPGISSTTPGIPTSTANLFSAPSSPGTPLRDSLLLQMNADGCVLVLGHQVPVDRLGGVLQAMSFLNERADGGDGLEVVLQIPESVAASEAVKLIEVCQQAGFEHLRLKVR